MAYNSIHTGATIDNAVTKATDMPGFKTEVANYASLPGSPTTGDVYLVIAATAGYPAGFYRYSGSAWVFMGREAAPVDSVNTQTGAVVLDADDISDAATTNKFTTAGDISKLAGIEAGATADMTSAEIKTAYESNANTNAYTDAEKTKLAGIESGAEVNTVDSVNTQTGAVVLDADDIDDTSTSHKFVTASDLSTLSNTSGTNTGDQDLSSYQLQPSEGAFQDGDKTKLDGISSGADVTDSTTVSAAGAPIISSGSGAPSSTPAKVGDIYIDTTSDDAYIAVGTASASDWEISNDGAGSGSTNLSWTASTSTVASSTGTDATLTNADATYAGLMSSADKIKLDGIDPLAEVNAVDSVNAQTGTVVLDADDIDDSSTTNKFTNASDITRLSAVEAGAQVNVNADWNSSSGDSQILNKPTLTSGTVTSVGTGTGLSGGPITSTGTVSLANTAVSAGSYTSADITVDAQGRLTAASSGFSEVSQDTTPVLGGDLDVSSYDIVSVSNANIDLAPNGTGSVVVRGNDTSGKIILNCELNSHGVTIKGPPHSAGATYTLTLPNDDGAANSLVQSDGSGNLSFVTSATLTELDVTTLDMAGPIQELVYTANVTGTYTLSAGNGTIQNITLTGDVTTVTDSLADGEAITAVIDDGSGYQITWGTTKWVGGSAPTLDTTNKNVIVLWKVGSDLYGMLAGVAS